MMESIKKQIFEIYNVCRNLTEDRILNASEDPFHSHVERLNRIAALEIEDREVDTLISDERLQEAVRKISVLKRIHALRMERERAQAVIHSASPWETLKRFIYYPNYFRLAEMEFTGAGLSRHDRVAFLGSGPMPLSLITMVIRYDIKGIGIEKDPFNADLSSKVIDALGLGKQIEIVLGDHFSLPLSSQVNLVMVGADAIPKDEIFKHLAETLPDGMKVSYRIYEKGLRRFFNVNDVGMLPSNLYEYKRIRPKPPVNNTSVFMVKTDQP